MVDIGGGSTELVLGCGPEVVFFASLQAGTVRHTERHLHHDPPQPEELEALADDVHGLIAEALADEPITAPSTGSPSPARPPRSRRSSRSSTPTTPSACTATCSTSTAIQRMFSMLASKPLDERLEVTGLHPGRAPTIVAGVVILIQVMRAFGLTEIEVSEHDIL